jgi:hypothetical protein
MLIAIFIDFYLVGTEGKHKVKGCGKLCQPGHIAEIKTCLDSKNRSKHFNEDLIQH